MLYKVLFIIICSFILILGSCASTPASAEEYFSIGMAYFDLGRYEEAEKWLNRARQADRTMVASTYNLGRLAYERKRYEEAVEYFESILRRDPDNILALKAAAYTRIMMGDLNNAEKHYSRVLTLVPESADNGYNHALVLYAMGRFSDAEEVLERYPFALQENKDVHLLHARCQKAQNKIDAINNYSSWLILYTDHKARFEYAQVLEHHQFYARALEEHRKNLAETTATSVDPKRSDIRFSLARVLLTADSASGEGIVELEGAVRDGFSDIEAVEELLKIDRISTANANSIRSTITNMRRALSENESENENESDNED
ncbi:MAG: tetratricopeptide repeat protein [Treponema sp.]|nr:tetratricopeptide repeat protein [Treponema sp.]